MPFGKLADLRLDDVRSRGRAVRHVPFVLPVEERRLFLRPAKEIRNS